MAEWWRDLEWKAHGKTPQQLASVRTPEPRYPHLVAAMPHLKYEDAASVSFVMAYDLQGWLNGKAKRPQWMNDMERCPVDGYTDSWRGADGSYVAVRGPFKDCELDVSRRAEQRRQQLADVVRGVVEI